MLKKITLSIFFVTLYFNTYAQLWGLFPADKPVDYIRKSLIILLSSFSVITIKVFRIFFKINMEVNSV